MSRKLAAEFEVLRPQLTRVAYGMLGSLAEAEDVVQEAWLRLGRVDRDEIDDLRAWLTTVVGRLALDALGSSAPPSSSTTSSSCPSTRWARSSAARPPPCANWPHGRAPTSRRASPASPPMPRRKSGS
jgi:DNA-directed RNA polymerase specialized sigma24 family protein